MGANDGETIQHKFRSKTPKLLRILRSYFANNTNQHDTRHHHHHHMENGFFQKNDKYFDCHSKNETLNKHHRSIRNAEKSLTKSCYTFDQPKKKKNLQKWKVKLFSSDKKEQIVLKRQTNFDDANNGHCAIGELDNGFDNIQTFRRKNHLDFHQNPPKPDRRKGGKRVERKNQLENEKKKIFFDNNLSIQRCNSLKSFHPQKSNSINRSQTLSIVNKELYNDSINKPDDNDELKGKENYIKINEDKCSSEKEKNNIDKNITDVMLKRFNQSIRLKKSENLPALPSTVLPETFSKTFLIPIGKYLNGEPMYEIVQMESINNREESSEIPSIPSKLDDQEVYDEPNDTLESGKSGDSERERKPMKQNTFRSSLHLKSMLTCTGEKRFVPFDISKETEENVNRIEINLNTSQINDTLSTTCTNYQTSESDIDDSLLNNFNYHQNDKTMESLIINNQMDEYRKRNDDGAIKNELCIYKKPSSLLINTNNNNNNNNNIINHIDIIKAKVFDYYKKNPQFPSASNSSTSSSTKYRKNSLEYKLSIDSDNSSYHSKTPQKNFSIFENFDRLNEIITSPSSISRLRSTNSITIQDHSTTNNNNSELTQLKRSPPLSHELFPPSYGEALRHLAQVEHKTQDVPTTTNLQSMKRRNIEKLPTYRQHVGEFVNKRSMNDLSMIDKDSFEKLNFIQQLPINRNQIELLSSPEPPPLPPPISYFQTTTTPIGQTSLTEDISQPSVKPKMKRETRSYTYLPTIIGEKIPLAVSRHLPEDLLSGSKLNENETSDNRQSNVSFNIENSSSSSSSSSSDSRFSQSNSSSLNS
ncbi:hypothetical protein SNEBB_010303 [Seison nebaliae]|nr:hypothetical protein SNEBB_010303 [Seison nebaliae]